LTKEVYKLRVNIYAIGFNIDDKIMQILQMDHIYNDWNGKDLYNDDLFFEFHDKYGIEPIAIGNVYNSTTIESPIGFSEEVRYLFFDVKETQNEEWPDLEKLVTDIGASWTTGTWQQVFTYKGEM